MSAVHPLFDEIFSRVLPSAGQVTAADREESLRHALITHPEFISEAIGNVDLTGLVSAYNRVDLSGCWQAINELVNAHLQSLLADPTTFPYGTSTVRRLEKLCALLGVDV